MPNAPKSTRRLRTWLILIYSAYVTLRISIVYIAYTFYYKQPQLRQKGDWLLHWWSNQLLKSARLNLKSTDFPHNHTALENKRPCIIMSNHRSFYDIPLILLAAKPLTIRMVTKQELFKIPLWGRALRLSEFIPLNRQNKRLAIKQLQYAKTKLNDGIALWISPEGTRSRDEKLLPFKNGGFKLAKTMDAIIIPAFIQYPFDVFNHKNHYQLGIDVSVFFGTPIDTREYNDINALRDTIFDSIENIQKKDCP